LSRSTRNNQVLEQPVRTFTNRAIISVLMILLLLAAGCAEPGMPGPAEGSKSVSAANPLAGKKIPAFSATDLNGQVVTEQVFQQHTLTMVNLWGTFCQPCIREMPDLQRLQDKYQTSGVKVLGVVVDKDAAAAKRITASTAARYQNVIPDATLEQNVCRAFAYVPATIFVDSNGRIFEEMVSGSNNLEGYSRVIDGLLKK